MSVQALRSAEPRSDRDALSGESRIEAGGAVSESEARVQPAAYWRRLLHRAAPVGIVAIIAALGYLLAKMLAGLDLSAVAASALGTPPHVFALSLFFSALSYSAL